MIVQCPLLVLAGGFGTRLRSAVADVPKPLAPVMGTPYLHYLLEQWADSGIDRLIFLLHHQAEMIKAFLATQSIIKNFTIETLTEPQPLGTGGAVAFAVRQCQLQDAFMVTNADTWLGSGLQAVSEAKNLAMAIIRVNNLERYGSVKTEEGRVVAFIEKEKSNTGSGWINAGLYRLNAHLFDDWNGLPFSLERDLFPKLVERGQLQAVPLNTDFIDIGIPEDYARFCRWIESGRKGVL